ncbi:MAG: hypothetical protein RLZZ461_720 [Planctomycetota bacterium]|jgi:hypothetical protein
MTLDRRAIRISVAGLLMSAIAMCLVGCGSTPAPVADGVPEDGIIAAGVVVGPGLVREIQQHPEDWPVHLRPGRAIILADGSLRADVGPTLDLGDRPGVSRHLRRAQLAELWRDLDGLGLGSSEAGNYEGNPKLLQPGRREVLQVLECRRDGRDWIVVHRFEVPAPATGDEKEAEIVAKAELDEDPRLRAAIRRIAALAWAADLPPDGVPRYPERYDFGPDPWARYRATEDSGS